MPKVPFWVFILLAVIYFSSVRVDTMDVDASQYAEISREMSISKDYLHLYDGGQNYLDKPPMLFWVSSVSMQVFGANNFAYKLPSILFALWSLFALYRLAKLLYDEETGRVAALILGTCQGMFLWTNDVRCDTILMSFVITAIWLLQEWIVHKKWKYLIGGFAAIAGGMMTKGPIALMVPVFSFSADWVLKRQWKNFFRWQYLVGIMIIALLLLPMSIGLYQQYDMHPEAVVNGQTGVSGLRFFYWTQSFGRITGENTWKNGADFFFLLQSMSWAFLPWGVLFVAALILNTADLVKQKFKLTPQQEWISTGGFLLTYVSLAVSKYQLPHYIFVAFPLVAIMVAKLLRDFILQERYKKLYAFLKPFQTVITALIFIAVLLMLEFVFPAGVMGWVLWGAGVAIWLYIAFSKKIKGKLLWVSAAGIIIANVFVTNHFYYHLLHYQMGSLAGRYIRDAGIKAEDIATFKPEDPKDALPFYAKERIASDDLLPSAVKRKYLLTTDMGKKELDSAKIIYTVLNSGGFYKVSELTPEFLNPATRVSVLKNYYILKLQ